MEQSLQLPIIDLTSRDRSSNANSIRQIAYLTRNRFDIDRGLISSWACTEHGFFYLVNHGVEEELLQKVFDESRKFFSLTSMEKMKFSRKEHRGFTPLFAEKPDLTNLNSKGDAKESFYIGPLKDNATEKDLNQWPPTEIFPTWRSTMESFYKKVMLAARQVISLMAMALNLDENFFEKIGALDNPAGFLRLLHYPGDLESHDEEICGAAAHSDYGMITLLVNDGVRGLQVCRDKFNQPQLWEDVLHIDNAFIVNLGDMMERWTNGLFRSTLHRVVPMGERYSVAFFLDPNDDCVVECLESCCSESSPPRFAPIRSGDYLQEKFKLIYSS